MAASVGRKRLERPWVGRPRRPDRAEAGIAAVDALVALTILSATITLSLQALDTARRVADLAAETHHADVFLRRLLDAPVSSFGLISGRSDRFDWRMSVIAQTAASGANPSLCRRAIALTSIKSGRSYAAATIAACPPVQGG
jgi:hypothetical protein